MNLLVHLAMPSNILQDRMATKKVVAARLVPNLNQAARKFDDVDRCVRIRQDGYAHPQSILFNTDRIGCHKAADNPLVLMQPVI
jgi:hypothetical protein